MLLSYFLLLAVQFNFVTSYKCVDGSVVNPPVDLSKLTYYPAGWLEGQPIPTLDQNQGCVFTVNIPKGYYANVTFYKYSSIDDYFYVMYSNNQQFPIINDDHHPFLFVYPFFKVVIRTFNTSDPFAFKVSYQEVPNVQRNVVNIYKKSPPVAVLPNRLFNTFVADSNSHVALIGFTPAEPSQNYLLRQSAIFDGDRFDDKFMGTLETIQESILPFKSWKNKMSVYTFGLDAVFNYPLVMGQDYNDVKEYTKYRGINCPPSGDCKLTIDGSWGNSLIATDYNGVETLKSLDKFPDTCTINIYENYVSNTTRIASLTATDYLQQLPLKINGVLKFYELIGYGDVTMIVTRDVSRAVMYN